MDTKAMIVKLNSVFCENNKSGTRYSKVWLTDFDFGGLYEREVFELHVQAEHEIKSCNAEIKNVISLLSEKAKEELKYIWKVSVYNANAQVHCWEDGLIVLDE